MKKKINMTVLMVRAVESICHKFAPHEPTGGAGLAYVPPLEVTQADIGCAVLAACLKQRLQPSAIRRFFPVNGEEFTPGQLGLMFETVLRRNGAQLGQPAQFKELESRLDAFVQDLAGELVNAQRSKVVQGEVDLGETLEKLDEGKYLPQLGRFGALSAKDPMLFCAVINAFRELPSQVDTVTRAFPLFAGLLPHPLQGSELKALVSILAQISQI